ncbi:small VCP/p97-interacting protein isoform X2 [Leptopilina boulardi]|uniref:small VCP/p97-interacting protein isoform X2 n=1 Tax=Leptopilina boulardi TaxID=63433 RepID=UPI0021F669E2|nr:small VCP/p97-interacting protein isoform X2 [Leptopilina boulardi]
MGIFASCCKPSDSYQDLTPDPEVKRRQMTEAAEKRQMEQESRGIKNMDAVKRQQRLDEERRQREEIGGNNANQGPLKWQME